MPSTCSSSAPSGSTTRASATSSCPTSPAAAACSSSTRRTASATGATTSGPTTAASATCSPGCPPTPRCSPPRRPPTRGSSPTSSSSSRSAAGRCSRVRGGLARDSLRLGVLRSMSPEQRLGWLVAHLDELPGSGIVYTLTVSAAEDVAAALSDAGLPVASYTGRTDPADRERLEGALRRNEVKALVATSALGMGFDKPDLGFVVHLGAPSSPVAYYQQVGRAGRATERADVLLLPGPEDQDIWPYFASVSMPREEQADAVLRALAESGRAAVDGGARDGRRRAAHPPRAAAQGARRRRRRAAGRPAAGSSTGVPWTYDAERYARVAAARQAEQQLMVDYERTDACRMAFLQESLDDDDGRAVRSLRRLRRPLVPHRGARPRRRRRPRAAGPGRGRPRPAGAVAHRHGPARRAGQGQDPARRGAAARSGAGPALRPRLGPAAARGAARGRARATPTCCAACVPVLAEWGWAQRPVGVVAVPSRTRPQLVALARRGARRDRAAAAARVARPRPRRAHRRARRQQRVPARGGLGAPRRRARARRAPWPPSTGRCCSSTTSCRRAGPSPSPGAPCAWPGAAGVLPFALAVDG